MDLTYTRYLEDEGLREELERRAHRERAEEMYRFLAQWTSATVRTQHAREDACHSYASR